MNISEAIIFISPGGQKWLLGLSFLERLILYGTKAGLEKFWLYSQDSELATQVLEKISTDKRFKRAGVKVELLPADFSGWLGSNGSAEASVVMFEDTVVVAPDFFVFLKEALSPGSEEMVIVRPEFSADGVLAAPLFLAVKKARLPEIWEELARSGWGFIHKLEELGLVPAVNLEGDFGLRGEGPEALKLAERLLLETGRKPHDGYITRVFFRPLSLQLTRYLINLGVTPNQISLFVLFLEILSVYFIIRGGYSSMVLGSFLFLLSSIIDCCDGENARLTCRVTRFGTIFDVSADAFLFVTFFAALPLGVYRTTDEKVWLYLGAFGLLSMVSFYLIMVNHARKSGIGFNITPIAREVEASIQDPNFQNWFDRLAAHLAFIYRRDFFTMASFVLIVLGGAALVVILVSFLAFLEAVYFASYSRRRLQKNTLDKFQAA